MQVFLPHPDFTETARTLDKRRLQKQGVECLQLLLVLFDVPLDDGRPRVGHRNHPCIHMWRPYAMGLVKYALAITEECRARGIKADVVENRVRGFIPESFVIEEAAAPPFVGDPEFHRSHRFRLLQKGAEDALKTGTNHYSQFGWEEEQHPALAEQDYLWPRYVEGSETEYILEKKEPRRKAAGKSEPED